MSIPFTQYIRPYGWPTQVFIFRPEEIEKKAQAIIDAGYRFECEHLNVPLGLPDVSLTITGKDDDVAIELCKNGPEVLAAVDKLITNFKLPETP